MILIQLRTWFGPSSSAMKKLKEAVEPTITIEATCSRLPISDALLALRDYEQEFRSRYGDFTAVNFNVIGIQDIPDLTDAELELARLDLIEERLKRLQQESVDD